MKYLFTLLALLSFTTVFSQPDPFIEQSRKTYPVYNGDSSEVFPFVEVEPEFPGGNAGLKAFTDSAVIYPQQAKELGIQGKSYVRFIVEKDGRLSNFEVVKGVADCRECDKEAIRVLRSTPKWTPGKNGGKTVRCSYIYPVAFKTPPLHADAEEPPQFPGGNGALQKFLAENISPADPKGQTIIGKCYTRFTVTEDGTITDLVVARGVPDCPECDAEAIRVIKLMPKWIPGKVNGEITKMTTILPVKFGY